MEVTTATEATIGEFIWVPFFTNIRRKHPSFDNCVFNNKNGRFCCGLLLALRFLLANFDKTSLFFWIDNILDWLQSLKQFFINVSYHILVASLTLMALFYGLVQLAL